MHYQYNTVLLCLKAHTLLENVQIHNGDQDSYCLPYLHISEPTQDKRAAFSTKGSFFSIVPYPSAEHGDKKHKKK